MKNTETQSRRSQQRMVRRLVKDWRAIAKKKDAFAKSAHKQGRDMAAFRAMGIASAFRYCAGRLEYEVTPNDQAHRCRVKNAPNSPKTQSRHSVQRLVRCRQISNLSIHRNKTHWTFTFYDKKGLKYTRIKLESHKIKPLIKYLKTDTISPYYSSHLDEKLSSESAKKVCRNL